MTPASRLAPLTARGWGVTAAAVGFLVAAWLFGSSELAGLGAAAAAAVAVAAIAVGRAPTTYRAERWIAPARLGVGEPACARLRFTNVGPRPTAAAVAADGPGGAEDGDGRAGTGGIGPGSGGCLVPALGPGESAEAAYGLAAERRGVVPVGPLVVAVGDPFGLVQRRTALCGSAKLVVHPRITPLRAVPGSSAREARRGATRAARAPRGDDFFALREYEVGDDLRRVHWRSTARTGDLMLRQDEVRRGSVATVLLDTRAAAHRGGGFERALEVAVSVAAAVVQDGRRLRFLTTGGFDLLLEGAGPGARRAGGEGRWAALMEHLARLAADDGGPEQFAIAVESVRRHGSGPLAAVVGDADPAELAALGNLRARLGAVIIARCAGSATTPAPDVTGRGAIVVPVADDGDFSSAWNEAVLACGRRDVVPA